MLEKEFPFVPDPLRASKLRGETIVRLVSSSLARSLDEDAFFDDIEERLTSYYPQENRALGGRRSAITFEQIQDLMSVQEVDRILLFGYLFYKIRDAAARGSKSDRSHFGFDFTHNEKLLTAYKLSIALGFLQLPSI
eukprot:TRINITY_DN14634_c0_g1_i1.p1 TRINITY_DN14634_c0_g1~~TRINITY_DN14634_c0_g1_i1.p1  ORF type:complete len:137 (-),score=27.06 TRINITY_DN14634_c0_g1_i1:76-486(-)